MTMCSPFWILCSFTVLAAAGVTGSELLHDDIAPVRRCYHCEELASKNSTSSACDNQTLATVECSADEQFCITEASSSIFTSTLRCAAKTTPSLLYVASTSGETYRITCICDSQLCNRPLPESLVRELKAFASHPLNITNGTDVTDIFLSTSKLYNDLDKTKFYKRICGYNVNKTETSEVVVSPSAVTLNFSTNLNVSKSKDSPRAEALKHEVTGPSDDEEDDGEGSGGWNEEGRPQRRPAPDAPSSYLPAHENKGSSLFINLLVMTPLILYVII